MSDKRIAALIDDLGDIPFSIEPSLVRRRSRDYFWYSQALNEDLAGKRADIVGCAADRRCQAARTRGALPAAI